MFGNRPQESKFNLYITEEGEIYIKEYIVDLIENGTKKRGVMYVCSRSIIFENNDSNKPIEKYMFKYVENFLLKDSNDVIISKGSNNNLNTNDIKFVSLSSSSNKSSNSTKKIAATSSQAKNTSNENIEEKYFFSGVFKKKIIIPSVNQPFETSDETSLLEISFVYELGRKTWDLIMKVIQIFQSKSGFDLDYIGILDMFYKFHFDLTRLKTVTEECIIKKEYRVNRVLPLLEVPGLLMLTTSRIYYQPIYILNSKKSYNIIYSNIKHMFKRRIKLNEVGIEIIYYSSYLKEERNLFLEFENFAFRESTFNLICENIPEENRSSVLQNDKNLSVITKEWMNGKLSNYEYLCFLNSASNRTRNNLSQYPIFPWVISNYSDLDLDLNDPKNFRDLSRPIGKLNEKRFKGFIERFHDMPEPKYLYGTHYSTPAYVIGYLVRDHPQFMIKLQAGKFDHPDRLFSSIEIDWHICLTNPGCLKELIPEFYEEDDSFLKNDMNLKLGIKEFNGVSSFNLNLNIILLFNFLGCKTS